MAADLETLQQRALTQCMESNLMRQKTLPREELDHAENVSRSFRAFKTWSGRVRIGEGLERQGRELIQRGLTMMLQSENMQASFDKYQHQETMRKVTARPIRRSMDGAALCAKLRNRGQMQRRMPSMKVPNSPIAHAKDIHETSSDSLVAQSSPIQIVHKTSTQTRTPSTKYRESISLASCHSLGEATDSRALVQLPTIRERGIQAVSDHSEIRKENAIRRAHWLSRKCELEKEVEMRPLLEAAARRAEEKARWQSLMLKRDESLARQRKFAARTVEKKAKTILDRFITHESRLARRIAASVTIQCIARGWIARRVLLFMRQVRVQYQLCACQASWQAFSKLRAGAVIR